MERDGESRHQKKRPSVQGCRVGWRRSLLLPTGVSVICIIARRKTYSQTLFIWGISQLQGNPKMHRICIFWDVLQTQASLQAGGSDMTPALFWDINTSQSQPSLSSTQAHKHLQPFLLAWCPQAACTPKAPAQTGAQELPQCWSLLISVPAFMFINSLPNNPAEQQAACVFVSTYTIYSPAAEISPPSHRGCAVPRWHCYASHMLTTAYLCCV